LRRSVEYLAVAVSCVFKKQNCHRIRKLSDQARTEPLFASAAIAGLSQSLRELRDVLGDRKAGEWSVRDRLAHREAVDAGIFNVLISSARGVRLQLVGGGENPNPHQLPARRAST
jgi:hypothetical protein